MAIPLGLCVPGTERSSREKLVRGSSSQGQIPAVKGESWYKHRLLQRGAEPCVLKITSSQEVNDQTQGWCWHAKTHGPLRFSESFKIMSKLE